MGAFRLLLAILVLVSHTKYGMDLIVIDIGEIAVAVFFFISGYLMPLSFHQNYQFSSYKFRVRNYAINRFLRIYPVYWIALILSMGMKWVHFMAGNESLAPFFELRTILQNFLLLGLNQTAFWGSYHRFDNPAWSLDVELQYYVLVPFILLFWQRHKALAMLCLTVACIMSLDWLAHPSSTVDIDRSIIAWGAPFIGVFFFYQISSNYRNINLNKGLKIICIGIVSSVALYSCALINAAVFFIISLLLAAAIFLLLQRERYFGRLDTTFGNLSYPVFVFHTLTSSIVSQLLIFMFPKMLILSTLQQFLIYLMCNIVAVLVFSYFLMRGIESPIEKLRTKFKSFCYSVPESKLAAQAIKSKGSVL